MLAMFCLILIKALSAPRTLFCCLTVFHRDIFAHEQDKCVGKLLDMWTVNYVVSVSVTSATMSRVPVLKLLHTCKGFSH